ncbi:MAG: class I SAM-dependent methyltransferase [Armatimonadota bacterium]
MNGAAFDGVAWAYDAFMRTFGLYKDNVVLEALNLKGNELVVDLGGGTGHYAALLAPFCKGVTVVDVSRSMLGNVPPIPNIQVLRADALDTGLDSKSFDVALITDALHHIPHHDDLVAEARRILKPDGRLLILDIHAAYVRTRLLDLFERTVFGEVSYLTCAQASELISRHGFHIELTTDGWLYLVMGRKNRLSAG